jgi:hypothetical protein
MLIFLVSGVGKTKWIRGIHADRMHEVWEYWGPPESSKILDKLSSALRHFEAANRQQPIVIKLSLKSVDYEAAHVYLRDRRTYVDLDDVRQIPFRNWPTKYPLPPALLEPLADVTETLEMVYNRFPYDPLERLRRLSKQPWRPEAILCDDAEHVNDEAVAEIFPEAKIVRVYVGPVCELILTPDIIVVIDGSTDPTDSTEKRKVTSVYPDFVKI